MVAGINDLWSDDQVRSIKVGGHLEFTDFEAEIIQAADALSDSPLLVGFNNFRSGEFVPQLQVARANPVADLDGIFIAGEERSGLKVHQFADDICACQINVVEALAFGERRVDFASFCVN